jgi:hypothetical protein
VFRTIALGYLLQGKRSDYLPVFLALKNNVFISAPQWAESTCISLRYLQRLCEIHFGGLSPRYVLPLYYHLVATTYTSSTTNNQDLYLQRYSVTERKYFDCCSRFVTQHFEKKYLFLENLILKNQTGTSPQKYITATTDYGIALQQTGCGLDCR